MSDLDDVRMKYERAVEQVRTEAAERERVPAAIAAAGARATAPPGPPVGINGAAPEHPHRDQCVRDDVFWAGVMHGHNLLSAPTGHVLADGAVV